jgi:7,8-dihydropterin-6-yl-methyl-4-(beta-D-ribofuranosyl)aminobenzene 5'-phosphate synthase
MKIQEIDRVEITALVDNYTDLMRVDNNPILKRPSLPNGEILLAEHGLSLFITVWSGEDSSSILMDAGASEISLQYNADRLGVNLPDISALVISHGHDDHMGSLKKILKEAAGPVPVYIHPGSFSKRQKWISEKSLIEIVPPDSDALQKSGAEFHMTPDPTKICQERILITGEIERSTTFERPNPIYYVEESGTWIQDLFLDDQAVILSLKEKGLVVITGCAHAGIINTILYARKITGVDQVFAVIGGFHLSGSFFRSVISPTISAIKVIDPTFVIPLHCTGWEAINRFAEEMPNQVIINTVGTTYKFGE